MKVVKFKDGTYGVRKFSFMWMRYVFAVNKTGMWSTRSTYSIQESETLDFANEVLEHMKGIETRARDNGAPI